MRINNIIKIQLNTNPGVEIWITSTIRVDLRH